MQARQLACLEFLVEYQKASGGVSPSVRQIAVGIGCKSLGRVVATIRALERNGNIRTLPGRHRCIEIIRPVVPYVAYHAGNSEIFVWDDQSQALRPRTK